MKKRTFAILAVLCLASSLLIGCGRKETVSPDPSTESVEPSDQTEDTEEPSSETDPPESSPENEPETTVPTSAAYTDPRDGALANRGVFPDYLTYSNKSIPYGNDWDDKDATGLPNGIHYYESLYGKYGPVYRINTTEKTMYLTFDEGYEAGYTPTILDTLKAKGVRAVFFVTKQFFDSDPELIQRMIDEGHVIGNHSCAHPAGGFPLYVDKNGIASFDNDLSKLHKLVYDRFGYSMKLFRFPEGESSEMLLAEAQNLGYTSVFWSYAHRDYVRDDQPDPAVTLERCLGHMAPGAVYLLHAVSSSNTAVLGEFIDRAREQGYSFSAFPVDSVGIH